MCYGDFLMEKYDHINFIPPKSVASEASKGLEYRQKAKGKGGLNVSQAKAEGIGSGVQRAVNLKNRDKLSPDTVKRMKAFFDRHQKNKSIDPEYKNEPWKDRGFVSHLLWGGDPGYSWAKKVVNQMETADQKESKRKKMAMDILFSTNVENVLKNEKKAMDFTSISAIITPGKKLTDREIARALRLSIAAEHDAAHLYELIADATSNNLVKKVMQDVANEEKQHVGEFKKLLNEIDPENEKLEKDGEKEVEEME